MNNNDIDQDCDDDDACDCDDFCCSLMQQIVSNVMCNNLLVPIQKILGERSKHVARCGSRTKRFRSIYRDVLFLTFVALGRCNIDIGKLIYTHLLYNIHPFSTF